jgi:bifunctional enzyme CysN/CysC/sulfate adenylyltransferase subunit 1
MNEIAEVEFETNLPLFFDSYRDCRWTGSLILIDALTNATVGAAMIVAPLAADSSSTLGRPSLVLVPGKPELAAGLRDALIANHERAIVIDDPLIPDSAIAAVVRALDLAGVTAISSRTISTDALTEIEAFASSTVVRGDGLTDDEILQTIAGKI